MVDKLKRMPKFYYVLFALLILTFVVQERFLLDILVMTFLWGAVAGAWNITGGICWAILTRTRRLFRDWRLYVDAPLFEFFAFPVDRDVDRSAHRELVRFFHQHLMPSSKGPFYTLATIAFAELVFIATTQLRGITEGSMGLSIPFEPSFSKMIFVETKSYALLMFLFMVIVYFISAYIKNSKTGYYLVAIREDADASQSLGINIKALKTFAFCISAFLTAIGGSLLANYLLFIEPENVMALTISIHIAMIAIVGGMNSPAGPIVGSILLTPLEIFLRGYTSQIAGLHLFCFGLILILVVLYKPNGLVDGVEKWLAKRTVHREEDANANEVRAS